MESRKQTMISSSPGGAVEVGVLKLLPGLVQEVPARGAISNMVAGRAAFVTSRVKLANDASFVVRHSQDEGARVSLGGEGFDAPLDTRVVDAELDGLDADFIESERHQAGVTPNGEVGGVAVFTDDKATLAFTVELWGVGGVLFCGATLNPELSLHGKLDRWRTTTQRTEHRPKFWRRILRS